MNEKLDYLWTPETTLRLRDTSGSGKTTERCIDCGREFDPGSTGSALCENCSRKGRLDNNETHPEVDGIARCKDPEGSTRCLLCAKLFYAVGNTRHDQICPDCRNTMKESAKLVCAKCNVVICRLAPKILDSGFVIRPNMVLHSDSCNICKPGLAESNIIEVDLWQKTQRAKKTIVTGSGPTASSTRRR